MSTNKARVEAVRTATERAPRVFERPRRADGSLKPVREFFGSHTFSIDTMREHLPAEVVRRFLATIEQGHALEPELADRIAQAVLEWAIEKGATHFTHWFHPMTGSTAEKHDAFLAFDDLKPISKFTGEQLTRSEPDASSFPSGGMRSTFEARGYTTWDPTSPMFVMDRTNGSTLCIPSCFFSYHGQALDKKTPLLRSMEAIGREAGRLCSLIGTNGCGRITVTAGPEQEYFLVDKAYTALRPDLLIAGRALVGAPPPKGQTLEDHYFGSIPSRVLGFMHELEAELYKVGVPAQTRHNEVAPSQFEIAVRYHEANVAADHNQLVMELVRKVAGRHGLAALLHEKPFAGVNGSGKHLNWSLANGDGANLLEPGQTPSQNLRFLAFLAATLLGVHQHAGLLRAAIASHGNDFRLGANEAPPAIMSVFLGEQLTGICDALAEGREVGGDREQAMIELGVSRLPRIARDNTDRNRTSPFAFTGNKFEFRAVGANASVSFPLTALNTAVAQGIAQLCDRIEAASAGRGRPDDKTLLGVIGEALRDSAPIRFEGNNYASEWVAEAERRGLPHLRRTPDALRVLAEPATVQLFHTFGVLKPDELASRYHVKLERYLTTVDVEVDVLVDLVNHSVLPAALAERAALGEDLARLQALRGRLDEQDLQHFERLNGLVSDLRTRLAALRAQVERAGALPEEPRATAYADQVVPSLLRVRETCDALERIVADERWPLPRFREMLFQN